MSPDDIPLLFRHSSRRVAPGGAARFLRRNLAEGRRAGAPGHVPDHRRRELRAPEPRVSRKKLRDRRAVVSFANGRTARSQSRSIAPPRRPPNSATACDEVRILMLHGVLHLAGMDHENDSGEMARAEARWRKRLRASVPA